MNSGNRSEHWDGHLDYKSHFMNGTKRILFLTLIALCVVSACNAQTTQIAPTSAAAQSIEPAFTPSGAPLTEADVPRVSIEEARAGLEAGTAVIVDVRSPADYEKSHIAGSLSIPLDEIERNLTSLTLTKDQWIITYCT